MRIFATAYLCGMMSCASVAGELIYTPTNPSFGGSPLNSTQLMSEASVSKPNAPTKSSTANTQQNTAQQFMQMLQSQLYASLASSVSNAITGQNAQAAGTIKLSNLQVSWNTLDGQTHITMNDLSTGQITEIYVPKVTP
jgi:curli production assembly/transport component CsgF